MTVADTGTDAGADSGTGDGGSDSGTTDSAITDTGPGDTGPADGSVDAGDSAVADTGTPSCAVGTPLAAQCPSSSPPSEMTLCFENASGCPGDIVDVAVIINAPAGCDRIVQSTGSFGSMGFDVANPADDSVPTAGRCIRREVCTICTPPVIDWAILPGDAVGVAACPSDYALPSGGTGLDTIQVTIPPGLAPGDYTLDEMARANIISDVAACGTPSGGVVESMAVVAPTIRVY